MLLEMPMNDETIDQGPNCGCQRCDASDRRDVVVLEWTAWQALQGMGLIRGRTGVASDEVHTIRWRERETETERESEREKPEQLSE